MNKKRKSFILAAVVWVVVIISIIITLLSSRINSDLTYLQLLNKKVRNSMQLRKALIQRLYYMEDIIDGKYPQTDTLLEITREYKEELLMSQCVYHHRIVPQESGVNINKADQSLLSELLKSSGVERHEELATAICAWRGDEGSSQAWKDAYDYYGMGYECKREPFASMEELNFVKGFENVPYLKMRGLKKLLTLYGDGTINVNYADEKVMSALLRCVAREFDIHSRIDPDRLTAALLDAREKEKTVFESFAQFEAFVISFSGDENSEYYKLLLQGLSAKLNMQGRFWLFSASIGGCLPDDDYAGYTASLLWDSWNRRIIFREGL